MKITGSSRSEAAGREHVVLLSQPGKGRMALPKPSPEQGHTDKQTHRHPHLPSCCRVLSTDKQGIGSAERGNGGRADRSLGWFLCFPMEYTCTSS